MYFTVNYNEFDGKIYQEMIFYMKIFKKILTLCIVTNLILLSSCKPTKTDNNLIVSISVSTITEIPEIETATQSPDYIANTNTDKFHRSYCPSVDLMNEENKLYYSGNKEDLLEYGYFPCGRCNP